MQTPSQWSLTDSPKGLSLIFAEHRFENLPRREKKTPARFGEKTQSFQKR
jgi:hypothetical protein